MHFTPNLAYFDLSSNPIGNEGVGILAEKLLRIQTVILEEVGLTAEGCVRLAKAYSGTFVPVKLDVSRNEIGDQGVENLLPLIVELEEIWLNYTAVTERGCQTLATCAVSNKRVPWTVICLYRNPISDSKALQGVVHAAKRLEYLDISGCYPLCGDQQALNQLDKSCEREDVVLWNDLMDDQADDDSTDDQDDDDMMDEWDGDVSAASTQM